ncbi:MAG: SGNH/GDSL hydrolase family protein [Ilumatobacteraceae bacterium]
MSAPRLRTIATLIALSGIVSSCLGVGSDTTRLTLTNVGRIPGINATSGAVIVDGVRASLANLDGPVLGTVASGNRLIVLGDSILAGTANRYGGAMCAGLVPLGWRVAVEAEAGQMVGFGRTVLRDRIYEGWDAAVVFLGTNFGGSASLYEKDLTAIVESLAPRPTLLLTASLFRPTMQQVNQVIRIVASKHPNVSVLDWSTTSVQTGVLNRDKIHPTDAGRQVLVSSIASALGDAPTGPGACLPSKFTDDSLVTGVMPSSTIVGDPDVVVDTTTTIAGSTATTVVSSTTLAPAVTSTVPAVSTTTTVR